VDPEQRITLEFYKNQVLHALAPAMFVSAIVRARAPEPFAAEDLLADLRVLAARMRREFVLDPEAAPAELLATGLSQLVRHGALRADGARYTVDDALRIGEIHALMVPLLEAHRAVLESGSALPLPRKEIPKAVLARRGELTVAGHVTRPESLSIVTLGNAVATLEDDGVLRAEDGRLRLDEPAAAKARQDIAAMLGR
jgi:glycerol-3-phosphate O-acyltransferase